jgi:hypothetical protein
MLDPGRLGERLPGPPATGFFAQLLRRMPVKSFLFLIYPVYAPLLPESRLLCDNRCNQ